MLTKFRSFLRDETGATAIEYGLIAVLVSVPAIVALAGIQSDWKYNCSRSGTRSGAAAGRAGFQVG